MELEKRNFSDFAKFPGKISGGSYLFPSLYHIDSNCNTRIWTIIVRLIKGDPVKYDIDWDVMKDDIVPIKAVYLVNTELPKGTITQVYVETGVIGGKLTRHSPSYPEMKNEGKSNERNSLKQGLVMSRSLYLKKRENGFMPKKLFGEYKKRKKNHQYFKYFPMLVRKYDDEKKNLIYPLYVQPKLDGARCVAYLDKSPRKNPTGKNVILYTRQKKEYNGFNNMKEELLPILIDLWDFENNESVYVDGELYKHGMSLQNISGAVRNPNRIDIKKYKGIKFHIFDIFYPQHPTLTFADRLGYLNDLFDAAGSPTCIKKVPTHKVKTENEMEKLYKKYLKDKYEGVILRNSDSKYLTHPTKNSTKIRSKYVLKRKMTYSDEFEVVGYTQGTRGRDKSAILWICKTKNTNKTFNATPKNITYDERYKLFKLADANNGKGFDKLFNGRMMTIEYEDISRDEVPMRAKAVGFREHI